jgi:hypothetical protein
MTANLIKIRSSISLLLAELYSRAWIMTLCISHGLGTVVPPFGWNSYITHE